LLVVTRNADYIISLDSLLSIDWGKKLDTWSDEIDMFFEMVRDVVFIASRHDPPSDGVFEFMEFGLQKTFRFIWSCEKGQPSSVVRVCYALRRNAVVSKPDFH
jgi:hypothetical protein